MARSQWGSRLGFILAAAGSAIGLGAIWKFPYVAAQNGGGAFLLIFLAFVFTLGVTLMMAEMAMGRAAHDSAVGTFRKLGGKPWSVVGYICVLVGFLILSFYSVVGGWTIAYLVKSIGGTALSSDPKALGEAFGRFIANPTEPLWYHAGFMALTVGVVLGGVQHGIEKLSKFLMPALFILMLGLIVRGLTLPGAMEGVAYFLTPDFSRVTASTVIDALGLAFFSLSLGMGAMITYGSYVQSSTSIPGSAMWVVTLTTLVCFLAGLMVLPAVFAFGFDPSAGPGLTFITMPAVFSHMVGGQFFAIAFFTLLLVAALTSSVSLMEVVTSFMIDEFGMKRVPGCHRDGAADVCPRCAGLAVAGHLGGLHRVRQRRVRPAGLCNVQSADAAGGRVYRHPGRLEGVGRGLGPADRQQPFCPAAAGHEDYLPLLRTGPDRLGAGQEPLTRSAAMQFPTPRPCRGVVFFRLAGPGADGPVRHTSWLAARPAIRPDRPRSGAK
ncbi:sodium-dependent transporter [Laribacter hongkongensis]|uniref:sodium-dependent transporter n=1 Tax=Laribacter hongkongensis TaxID=168471 RepID=UPI001E5BBD4E|nr:sodium-dependent transporter [Laribacter hongkongensis]